ncbi:MAG: PQQ-dependent sugar dehydrogenase [Nitrososphaeraceae archaeon]
MVLSNLLFCILLFASSLFPSLVIYHGLGYTAYASQVSSSSNNLGGDDNSNDNDNINDRPYAAKRQSPEPVINDPKLKLEVVGEGLQLPTQMAFLGQGDILVLEKDSGIVKRILNGTVLSEPVLDVNVATAFERGLLGIAVAKSDNKTTQGNHSIVYLYYTESQHDGNDKCFDSTKCSEKNQPLGNRLYKYKLVDDKLINPKLLLDLPASPGSSHNGGSLSIGPDDNVYLTIGEVSYRDGQISNNDKGPPPDGRGGILRVTQQGKTIDTSDGNDEVIKADAILGTKDPLNKYYAYGIRNSFGIDFDPLTGKLWDTENGPGFGDEINLVEPGFNSGWAKVQGIWERENYFGGPVAPNKPDNLVDFDGRGKYSPPEFTWNQTVGVTSIKFLDSDKLGKDYQNDVFVGDVSNGNLYHFNLNEERNQLLLDGLLQDRVANNYDELQKVILAHGFNGITDIEVGPDGYLYVLSLAGSIFRITS